jgi:ribA/ribD-fused uncharacterized protein
VIEAGRLPRTVDEVVTMTGRGTRLRYLFFWGHQPGADGLGPGCLSQWWPAPFTVDGATYATAEHWMMAHKASLFGDHQTAERILAVSHPNEAKTLGRQVTGFDEATWQAHRYGIVVQGSVAKFSQRPELGRFLLGTAGRVLVEASPVDRIWGIGVAANDDRARQPSRWQGLNLLGFALMDARDRLPETAGWV